MKIGPKGSINEYVAKGKQFVSNVLRKAEKKAAPVMEATIDTFEKSKDKVKKTAKKVNEKVSQAVDEAVYVYDSTFNPPKIEELRKKAKSAESVYLREYMPFELKKEYLPPMERYIKEKEITKLEAEYHAALDKYSKFAARQDEAQEAFERLNGFF